MWKTVFFDLDGTLTDSADGIAQSVQYALHTMGIEEPDTAKLRCFVGPPLHAYFMEYAHFSDEEARKAVEAYREHYNRQGMYVNSVYPLIPELLAALRKRGVRLGVVTSKETSQAVRILERYQLSGYFDTIVGCTIDDTDASKEHLIGKALANLGLTPDPDTSVMVGDRSYDMEGALYAGIACVGVTYGYGSEEELRKSGADRIAPDVMELGKILMTNQVISRASNAGGAQTAAGYSGDPQRRTDGSAYPQGNAYDRENPYSQGNAYGQDHPYRQGNAYGRGDPYRQGNAYGRGNPYQQGYPDRQDLRYTRGGVPAQEENPSFGKKLWNIMYPILIWFGITNLVSGMVGGIYAVVKVVMMTMGGGSIDPDLLMDQLLSQDVMQLSMIASGIGDVVLIPIIYAIFRKDEWLRTGKRETLRTLKKPGTVNAVTALVMGFSVSVVLNVIIAATGISEWMYEMNPDRYDMMSSLPVWAEFIILCLLAPVVEELLFRCVIFRRMRGYWGYIPAAVFSAVLFGIAHFDIVTGISAFLIGVIMAMLLEYTGSIFTSMFFHFGFNLYSTVITILTEYASFTEEELNVILWVLFAVSVVGAVVSFLVFFRKNKESSIA